MPRKAEPLTERGVERLIREARETGAPPRDVADGGGQGLTLRLTPTAAVWSIRFRYAGKPLRIRLGDAGEWPLAQARAVAGDVRDQVEAGRGVPAGEWISLKRAALTSAGEVPAVMPRDASAAMATLAWTLAEARAAWGAWMRREVEAGLLREATVRNYLGVMGGPAMRTLDSRLVSRLAAADVAAIVETLVAEGKRSTARDIVRVSKRFWPWMGEAGRRHLSGVDPNAVADLRAPATGARPTRQVPRLQAVASMLAVASHGVLSRPVGAAIELLIYTAQRRITVVTARVDAFEPWLEREGWGIWWQGHRRSGLGIGQAIGQAIGQGIGQGAATGDDPRRGAKALPLPPHVWRRIEAYLALSRREAEEQGVPRSEWMYPAARPRRIGDPVTHLSPHTLTHAVAAMPGIEAAPHDVPRAFAAFCGRDLGVPAPVVGRILDHADDDPREVPDGHAMTRRSALDQMLALTAPAMEAWQTAVWAERLKVALPDGATLKRQIVAENLRQRGVTDRAAEGARRRKAAAKA